MALVHKDMAKQDQNLFTLARKTSRARTRRAAGVNGLVAQHARTDVKTVLHSKNSRELEQPAKRPQSGDTARDF